MNQCLHDSFTSLNPPPAFFYICFCSSLECLTSSPRPKHQLGVMQNRGGNMSMIISTDDAKPRLKWTPELHLRFAEAITHLGGADKATPKSLMRVMGIPGLTLYHLKSHLQKYRLGKSQQFDDLCNDAFQQDCEDIQSAEEHHSFDRLNEAGEQHLPTIQVHGLQIAQALRLQLEVQRQLHETMEVQKHLQLRIEAQGKYLQSVLRKAHETLAGYGDSSASLEAARAELSHLVSRVVSGCPSSSISELTELGDMGSPESCRLLKLRKGVSSVESSLTSSESSGRKEEKKETSQNGNSIGQKKRTTVAQDISEHKLRKREFPAQLDLNCQYMSEYESDAKSIDLNSNGTEKQRGQF